MTHHLTSEHIIFSNDSMATSSNMTVDHLESLLSSSNQFIGLYPLENETLTENTYCHSFKSYNLSLARLGNLFYDPLSTKGIPNLMSPILPANYRAEYVCPDDKMAHLAANTTFNYYCKYENDTAIYDFDRTRQSFMENCDVCYSVWRQANSHQDGSKKLLNVTTKITQVTYGISFVLLTIAIVLMFILRRLRAQVKNVIHMNLMLSLTLNGIATLASLKVIENTENRAMDDFVNTLQENTTQFVNLCNENRVEEVFPSFFFCRFIGLLGHYTVLTNFSWLLIEGFHLRTLLVQAMQSDSPMVLYTIVGWVAPLVFIVVYAFMKLSLDNTMCWAIEHSVAILVIKLPQYVLLLANFYCFIHIIFIVNKKLSGSTPNAFEKLIKSFLSLVPLLGMHYLLTKFIIVKDQGSWL